MSFDRRNFIGLTLIAASAPALAEGSLLKTLSGPNAVQTVHGILKEYLKIADEHLPLVAKFTASLQFSLTHTESPSAFRELLNDATDQETFANYVVQEFVISTNYLAFSAKEATALTMLG